MQKGLARVIFRSIHWFHCYSCRYGWKENQDGGVYSHTEVEEWEYVCVYKEKKSKS